MRTIARTLAVAAILGAMLGCAMSERAYAYDGEIDAPGAVDVQPDERDPLEVEAEARQAISGADFMAQGVVEYGGYEWTWYSELVLPGDGLYELNANGRAVDEAGFVVDGDGYISIATPNWSEPIGTIVDTPFGPGKVYDYCESGSYDVYCAW